MKVVSASYNIGDKQKFAKRLFKEDTFDLIHMHLKKDEHISTHHAPTEVIIIVRTGQVKFDIEGEQVTLTNEDILHLDPYEDHSLQAIEDTDLILVKVKNEDQLDFLVDC